MRFDLNHFLAQFNKGISMEALRGISLGGGGGHQANEEELANKGNSTLSNRQISISTTPLSLNILNYEVKKVASFDP